MPASAERSPSAIVVVDGGDWTRHNLLLRFVLKDDPRQFAESERVIEDAARRGELCAINDVVLCEFAWVLHATYRRTREEIAYAIEHLLGVVNFRFERRELALAALAEYRTGPAGFADALIGQVNRSLGADHTVTFDQNLKRLDTFLVL
jgi:predicted nucleic-acid-binding protein